MKRAFLLIELLTACSGELSPEAELAQATCMMFCEVCNGVESCTDTCFEQWSTFGGSYTKSRCADVYLDGVVCQMEHVDENGECNDPGCGDPYADMTRCSEEIDSSAE
jgi:hypothetical protein